jgi:3-dehydroquinate dehydratase-1
VIVASFDTSQNLVQEVQKAKKWGAHLLELRLDLFPPKEREKAIPIILAIKKVCKLPILATIRSKKEQGPGRKTSPLTDEKRLKLFKKVLPLVQWIDIELSSNSINRSLVKKAHALKKKVILSYHDFDSIPSLETLNSLVKKFKQLHGDLLKVAAHPKNPAQAQKFLQFCASLKNLRRAFIVMGPLGPRFRIQAQSFGSCLAYGYVTKPIASGQISVRQLALKRSSK